MNRKTRVFVYETISADPGCADAALLMQGRSMRDAMVADLAMLDGVAVTFAAGGASDPAAARAAPGARLVRRARGESPVDFLRRQAAVHELVWVVAPESEGLLSSLAAAVEDTQWLGCRAPALGIASSKRETARHLRDAGIAAPEPVPFDAGPMSGQARVGTPTYQGRWIVKPDDGCGADGVRRHDDLEAACADHLTRQAQQQDVVIEPWIDGEALSISLLCSGTRAELLSVNRQHLAIDAAGWLRFEGVSREPPADLTARRRRAALAALGQQVQEALPGLFGFVGIDVTWHPQHGPVVIEINPRVTCAYEGLSTALSRNLAGELLMLHRHRWPHLTMADLLSPAS
jgi:predicted ATP-grasp superfamily ATP-dependent carboligase